jgi:uncharacterized membrane protein YhaH (DUF805 family)
MFADRDPLARLQAVIGGWGGQVSDIWYYATRNERTGPIDTQQLQAALASLDTNDVLVWREGFADWKRVGEVPELGAQISAPRWRPYVRGVADTVASQPGGQALPTKEAVRQGLLHIWFSFTGRLNRARFWPVCLTNLLMLMISIVVAIAVSGGWIVLTVVFVATTISGIAIAVKRLHDRDKSGWWVLLFYVVPSVASGIAQASGDIGMFIVAALLNFSISIWALVEIGCLRGTAGPNRYGPDPLSR